MSFKRGETLKNYSKKLANTAILAGQIMLECNAESYRVEDTMNFILKSSSFKRCDAFAMATGVFVTLDDPSIDNITIVKRVKKRNINLSKIALANEVSRQLYYDKISVDEAYSKLKKLEHKVDHRISNNIGLMIICGAFAALFGGGPAEVLVAFFVSGILPLINIIDKKIDLGSFFINVLSVLPMVVVIVLIKQHLYPSLNEGTSIIGVIMPALPGTAITNAIRDTFQGDYNSGAARMLESFVIALSIAIGVALGLLISGGIL